MIKKNPQATRGVHMPSLLKGAHVLIIDAPYYDDISQLLVAGATSVLSEYGVTYEHITVPGALEIPQALAAGVEARLAGKKQFDGAIATGCVIRGDTAHFDVVIRNSNDGLMDVALRGALPVGNAILTVDTMEQARSRAEGGASGKGGDAAVACLRLIELRRQFHGAR